MSILYVQTTGAELHLSSERLIIKKDGQEIDSARLNDTEAVVIMGCAQATTPALHALMKNGIETAFLSYHGRYLGRIVPEESKNVFIRQAQYMNYADKDYRARYSRSIVKAKIKGAKAALTKFNSNYGDEDIKAVCAHLDKSLKRIDSYQTVEEIMGVEGDAAAAYFSVFNKLTRNDMFSFTDRNKRPPRDPINAMLSFGYTLMLNEFISNIAAVGMDPCVGFYHSLDYGRPSLALDLMEEFRHPVIDKLVLNLINRKQVLPEDFEKHEDDGVFLGETGRPKFLNVYHAAMTEKQKWSGHKEPLSVRDIIRSQVKLYKKSLSGEVEYSPFGFK